MRGGLSKDFMDFRALSQPTGEFVRLIELEQPLRTSLAHQPHSARLQVSSTFSLHSSATSHMAAILPRECFHKAEAGKEEHKIFFRPSR